MTRRLLEEFVRRPPARRRPDRLGALTEREVQVFGLTARGVVERAGGRAPGPLRDDCEEARHRILTKLGVRDRVQAVAVAYESGLVVPGAAG